MNDGPQQQADPAGRRTRLRVLGPLALEIDGIAQPLGGPLQRGVLAMLALEAGGFVSVDRMVVELWADDNRRDPRNNVQVYVSTLRRLLREVSDELTVQGESGGYRLIAQPGVLDRADFDALVATATEQLDRGLWEAATRTLRAADALWSGGLVDDLATRFDVFSEAAEVARERRVSALELQFDAALRCGRGPQIVADLGRLTALHPLRERFWIQLVTALYSSGRQADALNCCQQARRALADEAGLDPCAELRQLEAAVLAGTVATAEVPVGLHVRYVHSTGTEVRVPLVADATYLIGRQPDLDISLPWDRQASRVHAMLSSRDGRWVLTDRGSTNGTRHNGALVDGDVPIADGDVFVVGTTVFSVLESAAPVGDLSTSSATVIATGRGS